MIIKKTMIKSIKKHYFLKKMFFEQFGYSFNHHPEIADALWGVE